MAFKLLIQWKNNMLDLNIFRGMYDVEYEDPLVINLITDAEVRGCYIDMERVDGSFYQLAIANIRVDSWGLMLNFKTCQSEVHFNPDIMSPAPLEGKWWYSAVRILKGYPKPYSVTCRNFCDKIEARLNNGYTINDIQIYNSLTVRICNILDSKKIQYELNDEN